eukprot:7703653-Pyramimonas_sp.AAC.1
MFNNACLEMYFFRIEDYFLTQHVGIPSGGLFSPAILEVVLAKQEHHFDKEYPRRARLFFAMRHVDGSWFGSR